MTFKCCGVNFCKIRETMSQTCCCVDGCVLVGKYRCSACHDACYCSEDHQKLHWRRHKSQCRRKTSDKEEQLIQQQDVHSCAPVVEKRECRCMFCGENMILASEEEAVQHMAVCPCLQEQLQSKEPITVPSVLRKKMNMN
jgi:hypothetical protein